MINFKHDDKLLLTIEYDTRVSISKIYIDFFITYISPEFNGEYLYLTKDEINEDTLMYKIKNDFEFIDLNYEVSSISEAYGIIGEFIEKLRYTVTQYTGGVKKKQKTLKKKQIKILEVQK